MRAVTFASGSSGNCTLVSCGGCHILIDAGISMRRIVKSLSSLGLAPGDLSGILITHEHSDHISGVPMLLKYHPLPIFAPRTVANHLHFSIAGIDGQLHTVPVGQPFSVGCMEVTAFHTPHDTDESVGYRVCGDGVFALATDMGHVTEEIVSALLGADAVVIESNHDEDMLLSGPYPYPLKKRILSANGHLSNTDCARLARLLAQAGTKYIVLGHLSRENNTPSLALRTVSAMTQNLGALVCVAPAAETMTIEFEEDVKCSPSSSSV